ncbi:hypothetical protein BDV93DRAFT_526826 [Ceratobasidium sp. AG-I]|nr:hypothetical protein BDV93DRAFT_526826 [Ceratobasidium sp. AG-I]
MEFESHFLAPASSKQFRKSPGLTQRHSPLGASLAHELAAAVMSEPSDSRALADELGLEFDAEEEEEGVEAEDGGHGLGEGLDRDEHELGGMMGMDMGNYAVGPEIDTPSRPSRGRGDTLNGHGHAHHLDLDSDFESSPTKSNPPPSLSFAPSTPAVDPIDTLKENVLFIDRFITQLQHIDTDPSTPAKPSTSSSHHPRLSSVHVTTVEPAVERIASDIIRHIDDARREREEQLRDLVNFEREFRKIDSDPGGADRLGSLEPLEDVTLVDAAPQLAYHSRTLDAVTEDDFEERWESQRDPHDVFDDEEEDKHDDPAYRSPRKNRTRAASLLPPPPPYPSGPLTPSSTLPHLAHMRTVSQILATSLSGLSEHVQVNGAAAAEAGRKLRALKNKVGDLQAEWTSAEESMVRIEKSEKDLGWDKAEGEGLDLSGTRVDGRAVVKEISASFFAQLAQVEMKVQAMFHPTS